jgi:hypothetical protein
MCKYVIMTCFVIKRLRLSVGVKENETAWEFVHEFKS